MATKRFVCKSSLRDWAEFLHEFFQNNRLSLLPMKFKGKTYQLTEIDMSVEGKDGKIITLKMNGTESKNLLIKEKVKRISPAVQIHFQRRFLEKEIGDFAVKVNNILKHNLKTVAMQATTETTCTLETFNDGFNDAITALEKWLRSEDERMFIEGVRTYVEAMPLIDKITRKMVAGKPSGVTAFGVNPKTLEVKEVQTFWAIPGTKSDDPALNKEKPIEQEPKESNQKPKMAAEKHKPLKCNSWLFENYFDKGESNLNTLVDHWLRIRETEDFKDKPINPIASMRTAISEEKKRRNQA